MLANKTVYDSTKRFEFQGFFFYYFASILVHTKKNGDSFALGFTFAVYEVVTKRKRGNDAQNLILISRACI